MEKMVSEVFNHDGLRFVIDIVPAGNKYDWAVHTPDGRRHSNYDETAPSREIALEEAQDWARHYARTRKSE